MTADRIAPVAASYRDPRARVYQRGGRIFRAIHAAGVADYRHTLDSGFYQDAQQRGRLIPTAEITDAAMRDAYPGARILLEHDRVPLITYPYEWTFAQLKDAALLHLDLHVSALQRGVTMVDGSAYNIQFVGARPVFIDYCSFAPYVEGAVWAGHHQFCEQFLNPLVLYARGGIEFQSWYRGAANGIRTSDVDRVLPFTKFLSLPILMHVVGKAMLDRRAAREGVTGGNAPQPPRRPAGMSKGALVRMLDSLRRFVAGLRGPGSHTTWEGYAADNTYGEADRKAKHAFVDTFCRARKPERLIDLGGNTGDFSETAILAGTANVALVDADHGAASLAYLRASRKPLPAQIILANLMNPTPAQGWRNLEWLSLEERLGAWRPDALLALALVHHLAIGGNAPLDQILDQLTALAPRGIVEFVPKSDPTIQFMLRLREDIFADYSLETFRALLASRKRIAAEQTLASGRTLLAYDAG